MKKSNLKTGMRIEYRNGQTRIVFLETPRGDFFTNGRTYSGLEYYTDDLFHKHYSEKDIIKVFDAPCRTTLIFDSRIKGDLLWERKEETIHTIDGKEYTEEQLKEYINKCEVKPSCGDC